MSITAEPLPVIFQPLPAELAGLTGNLFRKSLPSAVILELTTIDRITEQELCNWLHPKERQQLAEYTHGKRNREWRGGRICAKEGLRLFLQQRKEGADASQYSKSRVKNEASGRPCFADIAAETSSLPQLSITHSKEFAAALVSPAHCGIDIQYSSEKLQRVKERFSTPNEEQLLKNALPRLSHQLQLTLLWCGKEAVKKMLSPEGIPGFHELLLEQLTPQTDNSVVLHFSRTTDPGNSFAAAAGTLNKEYGIALCCRTE